MNALSHRIAACLLAASVLAGCGTSQPRSNAQVASSELNAGLAAQMAGKNDEAAAHYRAVLAKDPHNKYALYNLGLIDATAGRTESAEKNYRAALQEDPNFAEALFNLAILRTGPAPQEAADLYRKTIQVRPDWGAPHLNLGFILRSSGDEQGAQAEFKKAVALDPSLASRIPSPSPKP